MIIKAVARETVTEKGHLKSTSWLTFLSLLEPPPVYSLNSSPINSLIYKGHQSLLKAHACLPAFLQIKIKLLP